MSLSLNIKSAFSNTRGWFMLCLSSIALGLSVSKPLMSLGLFALLIVWLADGNHQEKIKAFWKNKTAVFISSIYLISVLGLTYTSNFEFALDDLRRKIPLFSIPFLVVGFAPITKKELHILLKVFIAGVLISSLWSLFVYLGGLKINIVDVRDYSRFNSHIRFGMAIALAIFFCFYLITTTKLLKLKTALGLISVWLIASLYLFSLFTGVIVFIATGGIILIVLGLRSSKKIIKWASLFIFIAISFGSVYYLTSAINNFNQSIVPKTIKAQLFSKAGYKYQIDNHSKNSTIRENGYLIEKHIAWDEFKEAWETRSSIPFDAKDLKGQALMNTLLRFVTSKGLRKDKEAIDQLTQKEITAVEEGISNCLYLEMNPISVRLHKILWEYENAKKGGDINGHSVLMRLEYLKTGIQLIKDNIIFGVGTGDVQDAFDKKYHENNSILIQKYRLRTHNQYLTYFIALGTIGGCWFIFTLFYPLFKQNGYKNYLYLAFLSIMVLSMLTEDTLEIQAGISFFAFFNTILLFHLETKKIT